MVFMLCFGLNIVLFSSEMETLYVFHGNVRAGPDGVDLSSCQHALLNVPNLGHVDLLELRRCIRQLFDRHVARNKIVIEAVTASTVPPHGQLLWGLAKVTSSAMWAQYMEIVSNPNAPIYRRPMVYVHFVYPAQSSGGAPFKKAATLLSPSSVC